MESSVAKLVSGAPSERALHIRSEGGETNDWISGGRGQQGGTTGRRRSISGIWPGKDAWLAISRSISWPCCGEGRRLGAFGMQLGIRAIHLYIMSAIVQVKLEEAAKGRRVFCFDQDLAAITSGRETSCPKADLPGRPGRPGRREGQAGGGRGSQQKCVECPETQPLAGRQWATQAGNEAQARLRCQGGIEGEMQRAKGWVDVEVWLGRDHDGGDRPAGGVVRRVGARCPSGAALASAGSR